MGRERQAAYEAKRVRKTIPYLKEGEWPAVEELQEVTGAPTHTALVKSALAHYAEHNGVTFPKTA